MYKTSNKALLPPWGGSLPNPFLYLEAGTTRSKPLVQGTNYLLNKHKIFTDTCIIYNITPCTERYCKSKNTGILGIHGNFAERTYILVLNGWKGHSVETENKRKQKQAERVKGLHKMEKAQLAWCSKLLPRKSLKRFWESKNHHVMHTVVLPSELVDWFS